MQSNGSMQLDSNLHRSHLKTEGFEISCFQEKKSLIQFFLIFKTFKFYTFSNNLNVVFDSMLEMNENEFIYEK